MMLAQLFLAAMLQAAPAPPGHGGDIESPTAACWSLSSNYDTHNCLAAILGHEDDRLNHDYRRAIAALRPAQRERLRASERRWLVQLHRSCNAEAESMSTGSLYPLYFDQCAIFDTGAQRVAAEIRSTREMTVR